MKEFTKCKKVERIMEAERLKRLQEYYQISRDYIAKAMNIRKSRLERLENGEDVRGARTLLNFYNLIIEEHVLRLKYLAECLGETDPIEDPYLVDQQIWSDIQREFLIEDMEKSKTDMLHLNSTYESSNQQNSKKTRSNSGGIIYI